MVGIEFGHHVVMKDGRELALKVVVQAVAGLQTSYSSASNIP